MKAKLILESGREIEMELTEEQTEQIRKEAKWPQVGDEYWFIGDENSFSGGLAIGNVFRTKKEALNMARALRLIEAVRQDRLELNGDWVPDWSNHSELKHFLFFGHALANCLTVVQNRHAQAANTFGYFKDESMAQTIIDKHQPELLWYFTKFLPERG